MRKQEFYDTINSLEIDQEVKVRYYTYNRKEYIDVIGILRDVYDRMDRHPIKGHPKYIYKNDVPTLVLELIEIVKVHDNYKDNNFPKMRGFIQDGKNYGYFGSSNIVFINQISLRAYKIHQLRNKLISSIC